MCFFLRNTRCLAFVFISQISIGSLELKKIRDFLNFISYISDQSFEIIGMENGGTMTEDVSFLESEEFGDSDEFEANVSAIENELLGNASYPFEDEETSPDEIQNKDQIVEGLFKVLFSHRFVYDTMRRFYYIGLKTMFALNLSSFAKTSLNHLNTFLY